MVSLLHGDLGLSLEYQRPNIELIGEQLWLTLALAVFSFVLTWLIAIPAGIYSIFMFVFAALLGLLISRRNDSLLFKKETAAE